LNEKELVELHPTVWHVAFRSGWPSIWERGLLSAETLCNDYVDHDVTRRRMLSERRGTWTAFDVPGGGRFTLRDQRPVQPKALLSSLKGGMTEEQWFRLVNRRVYFFVNESAALKLARRYRKEGQILLTFDTASLLKLVSERVAVATINTGNTRRKPAPRGWDTFVALSHFKPGPRRIRELTVEGEIANITDALTAVDEACLNEEFCQIWPAATG